MAAYTLGTTFTKTIVQTIEREFFHGSGIVKSVSVTKFTSKEMLRALDRGDGGLDDSGVPP